eukprot:gnl/MRDRNA2_/MRDRNA2_106803_c0_seq1.p1 gnl/MRDRNA2_/MRDRNA2_106803_c0~~gnl/MRDRNA2_/MRDRNA2_106803_c0_seq1.p1  ORF type:complete len:242 (-),score=24.22 gnl/MRDRNA2_/MRDRNA2_106803_c0_seq1:71-796(-)
MAASPRSEKGAGNPSMNGLSHIKNSSKWSFQGRPKEMPSQTLKTPCPAHYGCPSEATSKFVKAAQFGFGSSGRYGMDKKVVPGPGTYGHREYTGNTSRVHKEAPSVSFTGRPKNTVSASASSGPGPGSHDLPDTMTSGPKYSGTARPREILKPPVPAPGVYDQEDKAITKSIPRWGFGTSNRPGIGRSSKLLETPGPGAYSHKEHFGTAPQFSMTARRDGMKPENKPGPGTHGGHWTQFGH